MNVNIILLNEVTCKIIGLSNNHFDILYKKYSILTSNYFFQPKYKLGIWDGKIQFLRKDRTTYIYLLDEIIPMLIKWKYKVALDDRRKTFNITIPNINKDHFKHILMEGNAVEFRDYQVKGVNSLLENGSGILLSCTGSGKTLMNAALVDSYGQRGLKTITIVPSQDLITQTKAQFEDCELDTGEYSGDSKDIDHSHVVSTWQALQYNPKIISNFDVVVVDECHGTKANVIQKLLNEYGYNIQYRFGLTGTLPKENIDVMSIRVTLGDIRYEVSASDLIEQGHLASLEIKVEQLIEDFREEYAEFKEEFPNEPLSYAQYKSQFLPDYTAEKQYLQTKKERLDYISKNIINKSTMGNVFILVNGIRFGKKLTALIPNAQFIYGKDKKQVREDAFKLFQDNDDVIVISTVQLASTGLNIKRINTLFLIDLGKSFIRTIQSIGRGLRTAHDKDEILVVDICSDLKYSRKHTNLRLKYYEESKYPYTMKKVNYLKKY